MAILFPSDLWIKALSAHLNGSESYQRSAANWVGDFTFIVEPDTAFSDTVYLYLALNRGNSAGGRALKDPDEIATEYTIRAPYGTWRKVVEGKLDPIQGLMTKQLKLQGNMMMIMRYPKAAQEIIACTKLIPTEFPG